MQSGTLDIIRRLVKSRDVQVTLHATRELATDGIALTSILENIDAAVAIEDYPAHVRGPCVLTLQFDGDGLPIHIVWGLRAATDRPAVLITGYRPDPKRWSIDFTERLP